MNGTKVPRHECVAAIEKTFHETKVWHLRALSARTGILQVMELKLNYCAKVGRNGFSMPWYQPVCKLRNLNHQKQSGSSKRLAYTSYCSILWKSQVRKYGKRSSSVAVSIKLKCKVVLAIASRGFCIYVKCSPITKQLTQFAILNPRYLWTWWCETLTTCLNYLWTKQ